MHMIDIITLGVDSTDTLTRRLGALYAMTILLLLLAVMVVVLLLITWRRQALSDWYKKRRDRQNPAAASVWKISGQRLTHQMDHPSKPDKPKSQGLE